MLQSQDCFYDASPIVITEELEAWWLDRFTIDEIRELGEMIWGAASVQGTGSMCRSGTDASHQKHSATATRPSGPATRCDMLRGGKGESALDTPVCGPPCRATGTSSAPLGAGDRPPTSGAYWGALSGLTVYASTPDAGSPRARVLWCESPASRYRTGSVLELAVILRRAGYGDRAAPPRAGRGCAATVRGQRR